MATYLVTGGAGFIGSHIVEKLIETGEQVRVIDNLTTGHLANLEAVRDRITFAEADIRELEKIRPLFEGADYVIHLAAYTSVIRSIENPLLANDVNIGGTLNVLVAARDARVKRVVFAGTAAVYGDNPVMPRVETQEPRPLSPYALTKLTGEYYCRIFTDLFGLEAVTLRLFNIFGPRQNPNRALGKFITAHLEGTAPTIFGDGEQSRDFTYVSNVVDAALRACKAPDAGGKAINVGAGRSTTINQAVALLREIFGKGTRPQHTAPQPGDVRQSEADVSLARRLLGYEPLVSFEEGLKLTVDWYRSCPNDGPHA
jgi:nucleoside-diphosphate-sugar epimerase